MICLVVLAGLIISSAAQSISASCSSAFTNVLANSAAAQCLAVGSILPIVSAAGQNTSLAPPFLNWVNTMCAAQACSNATLDSITTNITTGCSQELQSLNITLTVSEVEKFYPTFRNILCLKTGNTTCAAQTLSNLESVVGPLSAQNIAQLFQAQPDIPANVTCTDCFKESYNILFHDLPSADGSTLKSEAQSRCGTSFVDGATPTGVSEGATTSVAANTLSTSSAFNSVAVAVGTLGVITLATVFSILV